MSETIISVHNLGKRYRIGAQQPLYYRTLRDQLNDKALAPFRIARHLLVRNGKNSDNGNGNGHRSVNGNHTRASRRAETIWALKDVSFDVSRGEVIGVVGRNGAGKSTLLKILSRITEPTQGYADITGRIASLLEVGTGFHPELTGRENIFLNGSILGMRRAEIQRKFDEIVEFAEIEKFIDTAVKYYSSGMYTRLAFSVAAHLEPEILLVDEVLAVGDAAFQKKCLGKMGDVAREGRTVLFVSHNMAAVQRLCAHSLWIEEGRIKAYGNTNAIVDDYLSTSTATAPADRWVNLDHANRVGSGGVRFKALKYSVPDAETDTAMSSEPLEVSLEVTSDCDRTVGSVAMTICDHHGTRLINADTLSFGKSVRLTEGSNNLRLTLDKLHLNPGTYMLGLWIADPIAGPFDYIDAACRIEVCKPPQNGIGQTPDDEGLIPCSFHLTAG
ncbi:MAG TPA: ABC transporter ATP-binding protein [Pyrinomonadaceae bacterium]|nr:ABC transporter ATP-binding protein [Pyrinomonadaceae bacterium]